KVLPRAAQIKRFLIFYKEFDADEGEMTRTRKVKKLFIEQRYHDLIDAAFAGKSEAFCESVVKYRDGTSRTMSVNVKIRDVTD
ncbi:MAG: long-chain fatty acid--CoA ligase, partial [Chloroflexi bacterium]|nr:long-chain fatty acid--CoA ligase [Chloroflexota bacterium]